MVLSSRQKVASAAGVIAVLTGLVMGFEGKRNETYLDSVGVPTFCYGETRGAKLGQTYTDAECIAFLRERLDETLADVDHLVTVPLPDHRRAALASFVYNVGPTAFARSTLLRKLNAGDVAGACDELRKWVYAKGRKLNGLVKRREAERHLCLQP